MGFNTAVIIRNDFLFEIEKDAQLGKKIRTAIAIANREDYGHGGFSCLPSQHADTAQVVVIAANSIRPLGFGYWKDTDEDLLRKLASDHGYCLVRKRSKAKDSEEAR